MMTTHYFSFRRSFVPFIVLCVALLQIQGARAVNPPVPTPAGKQCVGPIAGLAVAQTAVVPGAGGPRVEGPEIDRGEKTPSAQEVQLTEQLEHQGQEMQQLRGLNQREANARRSFISDMVAKSLSFLKFGKQWKRHVLVIRLSGISDLNNDHLTISHTERILELIMLDLSNAIGPNLPGHGVIMHRWKDFYVSVALPSESTPIERRQFIESHVMQKVRDSLTNYVRATSGKRGIPNHTPAFWDTFFRNNITFELLEIDKNLVASDSQNSVASVYRSLMVEAHIQSAFSKLTYGKFDRAQYETWRVQAVQRFARLDGVMTQLGVTRYEFLYNLNQLSKGEGQIFHTWLRLRTNGRNQIFNDVNKWARELLQDMQVASFLQFFETPSAFQAADGPSLTGMNAFRELPESPIERRRLFLERVMTRKGTVIATDFPDLGLLARAQMYTWFLQGAHKAALPYIFQEMNQSMNQYFVNVRSELRRFTGQSPDAHISGDDGIWRIDVDENRAAAAARIIARPFDINSLLPAEILPGRHPLAPLVPYTSRPVTVDPDLPIEQAAAHAISYSRQTLWEDKDLIKINKHQY